MNTSNITNSKPKDFAELIGVSVKTLQRWDREGTLKANRKGWRNCWRASKRKSMQQKNRIRKATAQRAEKSLSQIWKCKGRRVCSKEYTKTKAQGTKTSSEDRQHSYWLREQNNIGDGETQTSLYNDWRFEHIGNDEEQASFKSRSIIKNSWIQNKIKSEVWW